MHFKSNFSKLPHIQLVDASTKRLNDLRFFPNPNFDWVFNIIFKPQSMLNRSIFSSTFSLRRGIRQFARSIPFYNDQKDAPIESKDDYNAISEMLHTDQEKLKLRGDPFQIYVDDNLMELSQDEFDSLV